MYQVGSMTEQLVKKIKTLTICLLLRIIWNRGGFKISGKGVYIFICGEFALLIFLIFLKYPMKM